MTKWLILVPIPNQDPSSFTSQKKFIVKTSLKDMTSIKSDEGGTRKRRVRMPRLAEMTANGMRSLRTRRAPWEKGLKTGMRR